MQYKRDGHIASRKQQSNSLCLAVNPPPFDKGGKCGGARRGDYCPFTMVVGMARFDVAIPQLLAEQSSATEVHLYSREPSVIVQGEG
ncbi:MAG TPA: hypothetical protein DIW32_04980 [Eubacterium sp.]|nr:hypothetical protein [Eubacterium sp.]